jgi:hypothetical protein
MVALVATPSREFIKLRDAVRASWSVAERKLRAQVALTMQHQLLDLAFADMADGCSDQQDFDIKRSANRRF